VRSTLAWIGSVLAAAVLGGCATPGSLEKRLASDSGPLRDCAEWYQALDARIDEAGVRDVQQARVPGFPYFRVDRLHAALRPVAAADIRSLRTWSARLANLDLEARAAEIRNLPPEDFEALPGMRGAAREFALVRSRECGERLREADLADPLARDRMLAAASAPDEYSTAMRILGLYAATRVPFASGVREWQDRTLADFRRRSTAPEEAKAIRYAPPGSEGPDYGMAGEILARGAADPLGIPDLSAREFEWLSSAYAPIFEIETRGAYDRIGALRWPADGSPPAVDAADPAVYRQLAYTRYDGRILLQLIYTIWFPERPAQGRFDILAGTLDGLTWRVTLAPDGEPLVYDAIHPCGCYHMFFPTARARPTSAPDALDEWVFVPQSLPRVGPGERPVVRIASATHAIEGVTLVHGRDSLVRYGFRSYDELRALPRQDGSSRSAFGPDGLIAGSERLERFLFWPMGIDSAGAMRQWGRHATAFVGRRHFDDADLFARRFEFTLDGGGR
jgi:hypothetical protein